MPKYMFILKRTGESFEADHEVGFAEMLESMGRYNQRLIDAGALVGAEGLAPLAEGFVVDYGPASPVVTDGPFVETHELFDGFWIVDVADAAEAREWAVRIPVGRGSRVEVRRIHAIDDGPGGTDYQQAERDWRDRTGQL
ncbi:YciI family protein [Mesorhizobium japonicum]|uniref:YciI family protein n=1 Tax=Mesorhizobium japonicum TaxID=2066070 RepID=UPI003B5ACC1D